MKHDPLFNADMPRWWDRLAFLIRGLALGFPAGYLIARRAWPVDVDASLGVVVITSLVVALLPSLPKAWIEQRNRIRAARAGTLAGKISRARDAE